MNMSHRVYGGDFKLIIVPLYKKRISQKVVSEQFDVQKSIVKFYPAL